MGKRIFLKCWIGMKNEYSDKDNADKRNLLKRFWRERLINVVAFKERNLKR